MAMKTKAKNAQAKDLVTTKIRTSQAWYALLPALMLIFHAFELDDLYRTVYYGNIIAVAMLIHQRWKKGIAFPFTTAMGITVAVLILIALDIASTGDLASKDIRHLLAFGFVATGCLLLPFSGDIDDHHAARLRFWAATAVILYAITQVIAIYLFHRPYGVNKNPHYLAQYALLLLFVGSYLLLKIQSPFRLALAVTLILLIALLVHSFSRPAWLSLVLTSLIFFWLMRHRGTSNNPIFGSQFWLFAEKSIFGPDRACFTSEIGHYLTNFPIPGRPIPRHHAAAPSR